MGITAIVLAEESLEMCLICSQETGEIPPQESHLAANWLGMLQLGFGAAWCFRCPGKRSPAMQSSLTSAAQLQVLGPPAHRQD